MAASPPRPLRTGFLSSQQLTSGERRRDESHPEHARSQEGADAILKPVFRLDSCDAYPLAPIQPTAVPRQGTPLPVVRGRV